MKKAVIVLFILVPAIISACIFALPDNPISELENRTLMIRENISKSIDDSAFQNDLESYLSDQFPFREGLAYAQCLLRYSFGQRDIGGTYLCSDKRYIQKITNADINEAALVSNADKLNQIAKNNNVYVMYVPSAGVVLKDEMPEGAPMYDYDKLCSNLEGHLGNAKIIDLRIALSSPECYYKTDHHWTTRGAYNSYKAFCDSKGEEAKNLESFNLKSVSSDFQGTLFSKAPIFETKDEILLPQIPELKVTADGKEISFYDMEALQTKDKYNVYQGGNHGIVEIENKNAKSDKTLLVIKDSFANSFVPFVADDYSKIIMLDERYTFISLSDYVQKIAPDDILVLREIIN